MMTFCTKEKVIHLLRKLWFKITTMITLKDEKMLTDLNSRTFSRFSRLSRLKADALFSCLFFLTSNALASRGSSVSLCGSHAERNFFSVSSVIILSSIAANLCFICCCSKNRKTMHDTRKTINAAYNMQRRISVKLHFTFCSFLS